ncbi:MAG: hypothetical protein Ta2G_09910 [Termitinemataceae bacterium]|nr:MAG: hypothetical protein Ta2G_09910 [Termitinemataceae bacterium]
MASGKTQAAYDYFIAQGFKPITKNDIALLKQYSQDPKLMQLTAAMTVNWATQTNSICKEIMGYLCSAWFVNDSPYFAIVGNNKTKADPKSIVDALYDLCLQAGLSNLCIDCIDEQQLKLWDTIDAYTINVEHHRDLDDYVYTPQDILNLAGKENEYRRRRVNKFKNMQDINFCSLNTDNFQRCFEIEKEWCTTQDCPACRAGFGCAKESLVSMHDIFNPALYQGALAFMGEKPVAYAIWETTPQKKTFLYFVKSTVDNFNTYWYYILANSYLKDVHSINVGADGGIEGLRHFKTIVAKHHSHKYCLCTFTK